MPQMQLPVCDAGSWGHLERGRLISGEDSRDISQASFWDLQRTPESRHREDSDERGPGNSVERHHTHNPKARSWEKSSNQSGLSVHQVGA